jgi:integrase
MKALKTLRNVSYEIPPPPKHQRRYLTASEWKLLYAAAAAFGSLEKAVLFMMYRFCLRASEVSRLRLGSLKALDKGMLYVPRGKGSVSGWVQDVTAEESRFIRDWVRQAYAFRAQRVVSAPLFPARQAWRGNSGQRALSRFAIYRIVQACGQAAGLPKELAHPHAVRHGFVMQLIERMTKKGYHTVDIITAVSKRTGHKTAKTLVEHYISETQGAKKEFKAFMKEMLKETAE